MQKPHTLSVQILCSAKVCGVLLGWWVRTGIVRFTRSIQFHDFWSCTQGKFQNHGKNARDHLSHPWKL